MLNENKKKVIGLKAELVAVNNELGKRINTSLIEKRNKLEAEIKKLERPAAKEVSGEDKEMLEKLIEKVDDQQKTIEKQDKTIEALNLKIKVIEKKG